MKKILCLIAFCCSLSALSAQVQFEPKEQMLKIGDVFNLSQGLVRLMHGDTVLALNKETDLYLISEDRYLFYRGLHDFAEDTTDLQIMNDMLKTQKEFMRDNQALFDRYKAWSAEMEKANREMLDLQEADRKELRQNAKVLTQLNKKFAKEVVGLEEVIEGHREQVRAVDIFAGGGAVILGILIGKFLLN